ncbi:MAG: hypothetical protein CM15mP62_31720 [Rhodospirillaceae bacterium]|nr:MAG: hypothetical protein CM15mP62_31720 [Rhodospirillaceae bacterium]
MAEVIVDRGLNRCSEVNGIEAVLYYPGVVAGGCDLIGQIDGKLSIIDFKQTNKPKRREWIGDYFTNGSLCMAHDAVYGTAIEQGVIMMCSKDCIYQEFFMRVRNTGTRKHGF